VFTSSSMKFITAFGKIVRLGLLHSQLSCSGRISHPDNATPSSCAAANILHATVASSLMRRTHGGSFCSKYPRAIKTVRRLPVLLHSEGDGFTKPSSMCAGNAVWPTPLSEAFHTASAFLTYSIVLVIICSRESDSFRAMAHRNAISSAEGATSMSASPPVVTGARDTT
jgi:hypothetical protein